MSARPAVPARPVPEQHHSRRPHQPGRPQHRQHLPAAEQRRGQLRQLHLDARPRGHRQRVLGPRRSPAVGQRLVLRAVQLRQVQASTRRRARPNCCLPTPAEAAARFDLGPFVAGIQNTRLTTHGAAFNYSKVLDAARSSTSSASAMPGPMPFTTQSDYGHQRRRRRSASTASTSARSRPGCRTSTSRTSPASRAARRSCPVNPKQFHYQIEDALVLAARAGTS